MRNDSLNNSHINTTLLQGFVYVPSMYPAQRSEPLHERLALYASMPVFRE